MTVKIYTSDADFDITSYPFVLSKSNNVTLTLNQVVDLDGTNDHVEVDGLITTCANYTTGSIMGWPNVDEDDNLENCFAYFGQAVGAASFTDMLISLKLSDTANADCMEVWLRTAGTMQWRWQSAANVLDTLIGVPFHFAVVHNGTAPVFYLNAVDITAAGTWVTSTDKTKWLKAILTDAAVKSTLFSLGLRHTKDSTTVSPFNGKLDEFIVTSDVKSAADIAAIYALGRPDATTPTNCVCRLPFRGDASDVSGSGNNGTLVSGASVINDPAATGIYSTASPEVFLVDVIDAGAGNYVLTSALTDTEVTPAGTSIKYKYSLDDGVASWSAGWQAIADLNTTVNAASALNKKRYLRIKAQLNSDGTATPTLSDMSVTYTAAVEAGKLVHTAHNRRQGALVR